MYKKVAFTVYPALDIQRARNFYEETLGLKVTQEYQDGRWIEFDLEGGGCFAMSDMMPQFKPSANDGGTIAFEVDDLDSLVNTLKEKNVEFIMDTMESPVCRLASIKDSEGNGVILHQVHPK
ncbi:MAG: VOC family protein [Bdellovibrionales bacterium]|nr:VOC family protein [Bdellovibrionales bacterium]MCB0408566.1 VOC family protein [Bdellovibrionales bacterium]